ncbi:unnamed protein product [Heligmosomoides polygyrus]|uniref:Lipoprotein n=1 Tax=Heligmosomoides polygyrus TaxID=6339 RepID=A0A183GQN7_HELPZ|nr:unnamed protein product [Heligmosomoides polygyrus]
MRFIAVLLLAFGAGLSQGCMRSQILRFQRHYDGYRVWDFDMEHIRTIQELHAAYAKAGRRSQNPFRLGRPELNSEFVLTAEVMILKRGNKLNTDLRILKRVTANDVEGNTVAKAEYYASPVRHLTTYSLLPDGTLKKAAQTCRELITLDNYIVAGYPAIYFDMLKELKAPGRLGLFETYSTSRSKLRRSHRNQPGKKRRLKALSPKGDETSNNTPGHFQTAKEDNSDIPTHMSGQKMSAAALERSDSGSVNQRPAQTTAPMANYETTTSKVAGESVTRAPKPVAAQTMVDEESFKRRGLRNATQNFGQPDDEETLKEGSLKEKLQGGALPKPSRIASERFDRDSSEKNREEVDINRIVSTVPPTEDRTTTTSPNIMDGELGTKNEVEHGTQNYAQKTEEDMMQETPSMMNLEQLITRNPIPMTTEAVLQDTRLQRLHQI